MTDDKSKDSRPPEQPQSTKGPRAPAPARAAITQFAETLSPEQIALAQRLSGDPRLKPVWNELGRRRRTKERERLYPSGAGLMLLNAVVQLTGSCTSVILRRDQDQARERYLERADLLERDARQIDAMPAYARTDAIDQGVKSLMDAAQFYRECAAECTKETPFDVARNTGDGQARGFARALSALCREQFGYPLYGTVATVASVVLECDITREAVREWCR